jgi:hypothetical protein
MIDNGDLTKVDEWVPVNRLCSRVLLVAPASFYMSAVVSGLC